MPDNARDDLITLVIEPKDDPLCRRGLPARKPMYRLKLALKRLVRDYGLRPVIVRNPNGEELAAFNAQPDADP